MEVLTFYLYHLAYLILKKSGRVELSRSNRLKKPGADMAKLTSVAVSGLFYDDDDDDANLWQLALLSKI